MEGTFEAGAPAGCMALVEAVIASLGRAILCLDAEFDVVHASAGLDDLAGSGTTAFALGRNAADVLGAELFGPGAPLRSALEAGERREGWGATVHSSSGVSPLVSVTVAPLCDAPEGACDPRVAYLVVLRSAGSDSHSGSESPALFSGMIGRSKQMHDLFRLVDNLQHSEATVLITGESGTGKELVARAVHRHSPRAAGPFVAVNCGAIPSELLESELFGHVRGAFTGAVRDRVGRFELASTGTLFLDEVGDLPLALQVKLLRVLQERTFERVGESRTRRSDARIVAATNRNLRAAVAEGRFRDDLYYRLRVVPIDVPPLRERREDIEPLTRYLLARVAARHGRAQRLAPDAMRALLRHSWPGNVRELENALEYAVAVTKGQTIHATDLPADVIEDLAPLVPGAEVAPAASGAGLPPRQRLRRPAPQPPVDPAATAAAPPLDSSTAGDDRHQLISALDAHRWRRAETARALGISRTTLWRRMRELGLI